MKFIYRFSAVIGATLALLAAWPTTATSQDQSGTTVPPGVQRPAPENLFYMYAGKTEDWGNGSGVYWAPDGTFRAVNQAEQSLGYGRWYVTSASRMCYEGRWFWRQDFGVENREVRTCTRFLVDEDGQIWSTTGRRSGPWFPFNADMATGNQISDSFKSLAQALDLLGES